MDRRRLLLGVTGAAVSAVAGTGCTPSDPSIDSPAAGGAPAAPTRPPTAGPSSPASTEGPPGAPKSGAAVAGEQALTELAAGILVGRHRGALSAAQRTMVTAVRDTHSQHSAALRSATPTSRPTAPLPPASATSSELAALTLKQSLSLLARGEARQATRLRRAALGDVGYSALLWGSMMVVADAFADTVSTSPAPVDAAPGARRPMPAVSDVEALQSMLRQLHAVIYGYQLALGRLQASSREGRRAMAALKAHRTLRDELTQVLLSRSATVPAAEPAYVPTVEPTTAERSGRLIRGMETALEPFCGLWLASAGRPADRSLALDTLAATAARGRSWGAPVTVWPGWQG